MGPSKTAPFLRSFKPTAGQGRLAIFILWAIVNGALLAHQGIVTTGEAHKYLRNANYFLASGHFDASNFQYYSLIILLIALSIKLHCGLVLAIAIQLLVSLAATLYFFHAARKIFQSEIIALAASVLLLLNIPYQSFNTAVQSESLFQSLSLLTSCYLLQRSRLKAKHLAFALVFIFILSLSRPLGILYIPAACIYYYLLSLRHARLSQRLIFLGAMTLVFLYVLNHAMGSGGEYDFMLPFQEEHIICGVPTLLHPMDFPIAGNGNSVYALAYYIFHHPASFFRLAWLKTISFWGIYRTYFSPLHNTTLLVFFYPLILMAVISLKYWKQHHPQRMAYLLMLILMTWGTVVLTCDDWNNRIFLSISPYLILLSMGFLKRYLPSTAD